MTDKPQSHRVRLPSTGDVELEARWDQPGTAHTSLVLCHPHPQYGGTMTAPLMHKVTKKLVGFGFAVLRFNFRGVGASTGTWGGGREEIDDVQTAVLEARRSRPELPQALAGWSFGAVTALAWQARAGDTTPYVGIAPPVVSDLMERLPPPAALQPGSRRFVVGDRDQFVTVDELRRYAETIGATVSVIAGSDHFFYFREPQVAGLVAEHFGVSPGQ